MKTYSKAPGVDECIEAMRAAHHQYLGPVTVSSLFVYDAETGDSVLKHQGYPASAVCKINSLKDRAQGMADATIIVDRAAWLLCSAAERNAIIDHELTHLFPVIDDDTGDMMFDAIDRPKLEMRRHDHQFGWFDEVAQRHGPASVEVRQAQRLMESSKQLYFDFGPTPTAPRPAAALER